MLDYKSIIIKWYALGMSQMPTDEMPDDFCSVSKFVHSYIVH